MGPMGRVYDPEDLIRIRRFKGCGSCVGRNGLMINRQLRLVALKYRHSRVVALEFPKDRTFQNCSRGFLDSAERPGG